MLLSNEAFLEQLEALFLAQQPKGAVFLTSKRYTYEAPAEGDVEMVNADASSSDLSRRYPCILRATDGDRAKNSKVKISTLIQPDDYATFTAAYGMLLKASLSSLRKKKKKKVTTDKKGAAGGAEKLWPGMAGFKIIGPKRGAGVERRRRAIRALEKYEAKMRDKAEREKSSRLKF